MMEMQLDDGFLAPASGCLLQRPRITEPAKEDSASRGGAKIWVPRLPVAARKVAVADAGAGNKPAGSGIEFAVAGNAKPAGAKKTKTVRVKQEYIDSLLARCPIQPFPFLPEKSIQLMDPKNQEKTRALFARIAANIKVARDEEEDILEQYRVKGYAEVEVEVEGVDMEN